MPIRDPLKVRLTVVITKALDARIETEKDRRFMSKGAWITEAIREKLERIDAGEDVGWGPLAGLDEQDRDRVAHLIECLHAAPSTKGMGFRRAVDANFAWLLECVLGSK